MICGGCGLDIGEGEHYMKVSIEIDTRRSPEVEAAKVIDVSPIVLYTRVHHPGCLGRFCVDHAILKDVFGR